MQQIHQGNEINTRANDVIIHSTYRDSLSTWHPRSTQEANSGLQCFHLSPFCCLDLFVPLFFSSSVCFFPFYFLKCIPLIATLPKPRGWPNLWYMSTWFYLFLRYTVNQNSHTLYPASSLCLYYSHTYWMSISSPSHPTNLTLTTSLPVVVYSFSSPLMPTITDVLACIVLLGVIIP